MESWGGEVRLHYGGFKKGVRRKLSSTNKNKIIAEQIL